MGVRVATADETVACERITMKMGTTSAELMRRAGAGAADLLGEWFPDVSSTPISVFAGTGNNGGDGWIAAGQLASRGYSVRVFESGAPRTSNASEAKNKALQSGAVLDEITSANGNGGKGVVVDALLGTGSTRSPRGEAAAAIGIIEGQRENGAHVIAIDLPSGVDATTGEHERSVRAERSISFGTLKRGHVIARDVCGEVVVIDIGLTESDELSELPLLIDAMWVRARVPRIPPSAHKGTRRQLAVVGGGKGMAGATILAGEGALRSGIGLLRIVASPENALPVHAGLPAALFDPWPETETDLSKLASRVDAIAVGPGLGANASSRDLVERILNSWAGPVVLDADALNVFAGDTGTLATLLRNRPAVITPHPAEMGRLLGISTAEVLRERFDVGIDLSRRLDAAVLLKGSPTIVFDPSGNRYVSASGTAALATGGSGDVLTGMIGTLLAQMCGQNVAPTPTDGFLQYSSAEAAACAAFVHGRAAELCRFVRGTTLDDVLRAMPAAWNESSKPMRTGVLAILKSYF